MKFNRTQIQKDLNEIKDSFKKEIGMKKSILPTGKEVSFKL